MNQHPFPKDNKIVNLVEMLIFGRQME